MQTAAAGPEPGDGVSAAAAEGVGAGPGTGREALSGGGHSHLQPVLQHEPHQPLHLQQLPSLQQLYRPRLQHKLRVQLPRSGRHPTHARIPQQQQLCQFWRPE